MNNLELKNILISQISKIADDSFLPALKTILDSSISSSEIYSKEYNNDLSVAEEEIKKGKYSYHNQVKEKMEEWKKK